MRRVNIIEYSVILDSSEVASLLSSNKYDIALLTGYDFCPFAQAHHYNVRDHPHINQKRKMIRETMEWVDCLLWRETTVVAFT